MESSARGRLRRARAGLSAGLAPNIKRTSAVKRKSRHARGALWRTDTWMTSAAEVVRVESDDRDATGEAVVALGLHFCELPQAMEKQVADFVSTFRHTVIVVDDDATVLPMVSRILGRDYRVLGFTRPEQALEALKSEEPSVFITDLLMPEMDGRHLLQEVSRILPRSSVSRIVLTGHPREDVSDLILRGVVYQRICKPCNADELLQVVRRAVDLYAALTDRERLDRQLEHELSRTRQENAHLRKRLTSLEGFEHIIGQSPEIRDALDQLARVTRTDVRVHIQGETGTGKELVARALHEGGPRAGHPFVAQNCAQVTETLLESTLFGHEKGAFTERTGASQGSSSKPTGARYSSTKCQSLPPRHNGRCFARSNKARFAGSGEPR